VCGLIASPRDRQLEQLLSSFRDGIAIAERGQKGFLPTSDDVQALRFAGTSGSSGAMGTRMGKLARASLEALFGKGRIVCGDNFGRESSCASTWTIWPTGKWAFPAKNLRHAMNASLMGPLASRQSGIGCNATRKSLLVLRYNAQSDQSAPVLADQGYPGKIGASG